MKRDHVIVALCSFLLTVAVLYVGAARGFGTGAPGPVPYAYEASVCGPGPCYIDAGLVGNLNISLPPAGFVTAFDCNFDTAPRQLLSQADGGTNAICTYPDGGSITWVKVATNFSTGADAVDGGLLLQCTSTGGSGLPSVCDGIYTSLAAAIPYFSGQTPLLIEVWENNLSPGSSKYQEFAVDNFPLATYPTNVAEVTSLFYRQTGGWIVQDEPSTASTGVNDSTIGTGYNVAIMWFPNGVASPWHAYELSPYDGGLPSLGGDFTIANVTMNGNNSIIPSGPSSHFNLFFNCVAGSSTTALFDRVRVLYRPTSF